MSTFDLFAQDLDQFGRNQAQRPFWTLDLDDDESLLKWLNSSFDVLEKDSEPRIRVMRRNLAALRGIQYNAQSTRTGDIEDRQNARRSRNPKIVINHMLDMLELNISKLTKFRPDIAANPASEETFDRNVAKISEELVQSNWDRDNVDAIFQQHNRVKRYFGESYLAVTWDPDKGYLHPDYVKELFKENGVDRDPLMMTRGEIKQAINEKVKEIPRIPLLDESGEQVTNAMGEPMFIDKPVRVGDIKREIWYPYQVFCEPRSSFDDSEWLIKWSIDDVENVRGDHPDKAHDIRANDQKRYFDWDYLEHRQLKNVVEVFELYHKTTSKLDQGRYVKWTRDVILKNQVNPYELDDGKILPVHRLTDIDVPGLLNGDTMVRHARPAQNIYNNMISMAARNMFQFSHPKWFVPAGSVKSESLANQSTLVSYKGPQPPVLGQPNPIGGDTFKMSENALQNLQQLMGVFGQSRGEPPPGVKAGVALQFLDEQENERENAAIAKHNAGIRHVARMELALMGNHYDDDEGRLVDILGKTRAAEAESFKFADLSSVIDVQIQTASALPRQKAARVQTILDLSERYPEELDGRQVLDMLDLGQSDRFVSTATVAVRAAEQENESLYRSGKMTAPEKWEDHLMHYKIHLGLINDPSFKIASKKKMREDLKDHIGAHEMLMFDLAKKNPIYAQQIMTLFPNYPIVFETETDLITLIQPPQPEGVPAQQGASAGAQAFGSQPLSTEALIGDNQTPIDNAVPTGEIPSVPAGTPLT